jgi:hypothetical protein
MGFNPFKDVAEALKAPIDILTGGGSSKGSTTINDSSTSVYAPAQIENNEANKLTYSLQNATDEQTQALMQSLTKTNNTIAQTLSNNKTVANIAVVTIIVGALGLLFYFYNNKKRKKK